MTVLHAGGKFGGNGYKVSGGLHGVGSSVVNALSEWLEVEVAQNGHVYQQRFSNGGHPDYDLKEIGESSATGTTIRFKPDPEIFRETTVYDFETLERHLRESAFLNAGLCITLADRRDPENEIEHTYCYEGGLSSFVDYLTVSRGQTPLHETPIHFSAMHGDRSAEIAMQYTDSYNETMLSFANNVRTVDGGTHETGFKTALTRVFNDYGRKYSILKDGDKKLSGDDVREGLTVVISVKLTEAQFEGQTKGKLGNTDITQLVSTTVYEKLMTYSRRIPRLQRRYSQRLSTLRAQERRRERRVNWRAASPFSTRTPCPASLPTAPSATPSAQSSTSSREIPQAAPQKRDATDASRPFFPSGARCSTLKRRDLTELSATRSSCP